MLYKNRLGAKFELHLDQYLMKNIYLYDIPEVNTFNQIKTCLRHTENPVIFDCGANIGLYSINLAKLYPEASIHAFEPLEYNFNLLKKNADLNGFKIISFNQNGVGEKPETLKIKFGNKKSGASIYVDEYNNAGTEDIQIVRLDDYCDSKQIDHIDLLKIDVEGGELKVLKGAKEILKKSPKCMVVVEVIQKHLEAAGDDAKSLFELMFELGYKAFLPKSWPFKLKQIHQYSDLPEDYADNVFFMKSE